MAEWLGQSEKMIWAEMAKRHLGIADTKGEIEVWESRGRDDVAVDVMTIVGSFLWSGPTFPLSGFQPGKRRYDDNLFRSCLHA